MLIDYRVRQREYLLSISRAITAQLDLTRVLQLVLRASVDILGGRAGLIALTSADKESLIVQAVYSIPERLLDILEPLLASVDVAGVGERGTTRELDSQLRKVLAAAGLVTTSAVALPLVTGSDLLGYIIIFRGSGVSFSSNDRQMLRSFADQAAIAVHNAQLYQQVTGEKSLLDAVLENSPDGVLLLDSHLSVSMINQALLNLVAITSEDAIGKHHDHVIRLDNVVTDNSLSEAISQGRLKAGNDSIYVEGDLVGQDGRITSVGITYAIMGSEAADFNIIGNVRDITRFREAEQVKTNLISVVSHELKTPVALIKGYAGTLRRSDASWDQETLSDSLTVIEDESDRLDRLINNLLDASRLQSGVLKISVGDVALDKLAGELADHFETQSDIHNIKVDFPSGFPIIPGDIERLRQVLSNLLTNAIKYSPGGGEITIAGAVYDERILVSVRDEGIGLTKSDHDWIFERFTRVDSAMTRKTQGAGLGLYLVRAIVEAHGGQVWVDSKLEAGSVFTFSLPRG